MSNRTPSPAIASARGRVAALSRSRTAEDPDYLEAQTALAAAKLEEYIAEVIAHAPPLSAAQRESILAAFAGFKGGDAS